MIVSHRGKSVSPCLPPQLVTATLPETNPMQNFSLAPSALADLDQYITQALDANDRAALTGLRAALACLAVIATPAELAKLQARCAAAVLFTGGRSND